MVTCELITEQNTILTLFNDVQIMNQNPRSSYNIVDKYKKQIVNLTATSCDLYGFCKSSIMIF